MTIESLIKKLEAQAAYHDVNSAAEKAMLPDLKEAGYVEAAKSNAIHEAIAIVREHAAAQLGAEDIIHDTLVAHAGTYARGLLNAKQMAAQIHMNLYCCGALSAMSEPAKASIAAIAPEVAETAPRPSPATDSLGSPIRYTDGSTSREYEEQPVEPREMRVLDAHGEQEVCMAISSAVSFIASGWTLQNAVKAGLERIRPFLREPKPVMSAPVSLGKFAISLCVWQNGVKSKDAPMVIWGRIGQAMRHAYLDQAKEALEAQRVPYVD